MKNPNDNSQNMNKEQNFCTCLSGKTVCDCQPESGIPTSGISPPPPEVNEVQDLIDRNELIRLLKADYEKLPIDSDYAEALGDGLCRAINVAKKLDAVSQPSPRKSLQECYEEIAKKARYKDFEELTKDQISVVVQFMSQAAELYASQTRWRDVKQDLPENDDHYLIYVEAGEDSFIESCKFRAKYNRFKSYDGSITHWMPLPPKPNQP